MSDSALDKFGKLIITALRDQAIDHYDNLAIGHYNTPSLKPLQADLARFSESDREIIRRSVISAVDQALHDFLFALEEADEAGLGIQVLVDGKNVAEISDGLHGEQFSESGWIARFGKHPESVPDATDPETENEHAWRDNREDAASCPECGKPLRTALAKQCFQCGASWH